MYVLSRLGSITNYEQGLEVIALLFYGEILVDVEKKFRSLTLSEMHES